MSFSNRISICKKIWDIENNYDVLSFKFNEIYLWPLIRYNICSYLNQKYVEPNILVLSSRSYANSKNELIEKFTLNKKSKSIISYPISKFNKSAVNVFFDKPTNLNHNKFNKKYSSISAAYGLMKRDSKCVLLELIESASYARQPRLYDPHYITYPHHCDFNNFKKNHLKYYQINKLNYLNVFFRDLNNYSELNIPFSIIDDIKSQLCYQIRMVPHMQHLFAKIKPTTVYLVGFSPFSYSPAVNIACSALGIRTVEIQNGLIGPYEWPHTHFSKYPDTGYEMLSNNLWVWDEETSIQILGSCASNISSQIPIVLGIPRAY